MTTADGNTARARFVVLNDEPVEDGRGDLLGVSETARSLTDLITTSRSSTPFTVAIDAGWGTGKSSLMRLMRSQLEADGVPTAWFNAWTSGPDALEVLIKSVLLSFDRSILRRGYHRLARRRRLVGVARIAAAVALSAFGLRRLVDDLWQRLTVDAKARNEIRDVVREMAEEWVGSGSGPDRQLVVFVDDLDRCQGEVVLTVCEAIKLYLDVPGLVFVIGCDQAVLARNVQGTEGAARALEHLEKIVQVNYRAPVPDEAAVRRLIDGYAERSGTGELFHDGLATLVAQRTKRNPRRIKRLINSFVLEYRLNRDWQRFGPAALVRIILLQHFYPGFYRLLTGTGDRDFTREFLTYTEVRAACRSGHPTDEHSAFFTGLGFAEPPTTDRDRMLALLTEAEQELPVEFPQLASNPEFVSLLRELRDDPEFDTLRTHLQLGVHPVSEEPVSYTVDDQPPYRKRKIRPQPENGFACNILWIDDRFDPAVDVPVSHDTLARVRNRGFDIHIEPADCLRTAQRKLAQWTPDLIISDISRDGDDAAGFDDLAALRVEQIYEGPVIFYTSIVTPARIRRARELGAFGVTADPDELDKWVEVVLMKQRLAK
ncbi:P-loop NTPase fold protein [Saccharopolyspora taberi]